MASQGISRRKGTTDHGSSYEQKMAALLAVKCALSDDVRDMWIATNVDKLGAFDDLVLSIERRSGPCITKEMYLIQIKHRKNKPISLTSGTNDLKKYQESFLKIQQDYDNGTSPLKNSCDFQDIKFLLFTNTKIDTNQSKNLTFSVYQNTNDFINTSEILKISHDSQSMYDQSFLKQMFFYTKQVGVSKIENVLKNEVGNYFKNCDVQQITKFFENWHSEYFENKIVLKKEDIQSVILQTVLSYYIPEPIVTDFPNAAMWNEVVSQFEFVFIQDECHLAKVWQAVNLQMCNFFDDQNLNIKKWKELLQGPTNKINKIKQHLRNQEVLIRKDKSSYSMKDLYLLLWQFCETPLILNININDSQEDIPAALVKLNSSRDNKRRYILLGEISYNSFQGYTLFNVLSVDKNLKKKMLKNTCLSLQNKESVTLEKLNISNAALEKISPDVLIELLQPATKKTEVNRQYIPRFIRQPTVSINVLSIREDVFVIVAEGKITKGHILFNRFLPQMVWSIYKLGSKEFSKKIIINNSHKFVTCIILNNSIKDLKEFVYIENIIKEIRENSTQTVHYFRLRNENELVWLHSNQNVNQIKPFIISNSEEYLSDLELFHYLSFNILSGNAGEGKSVLLEFIATDCPAEVWVIKLNIREIIAYIEKDDFSTIKTFLYDQSKNFNKHNEFYWEVFQHLYEEGNMLIIVDGVDEAAYNSKIERFLHAIKSLGIKTIIAARPTLRDSLENQFHMLSLFLKPFTDEDCRSLINLTLQNNYKDIDETFVNAFLKKIFSWNNILGVPLLLKLYVSLLSNEDAPDVNTLDVSDLFDRYINEQLKKVQSCNAFTIRTLLRSALFVFYNKNALSELFVMEEYLEAIEDKIQIYIKSKLIEKLNNNNVPVFAHKSLAEFLTAKYLSNLAKNNNNNVPDNFLKSLFYKELEMVRFFFDIIILKGSVLQDIITSNNHSYICNKINNSVDTFGRNSMDIAASYGNRCELQITQLLWSGVNIYESYNDIYENSLHPCQEFERKPIVPVYIIDKLLQKGFDPFKKDNLFKMDVFDFAIESGSLEVIEVLFSRNFIKPLENINNDILLYIAVKNRYINIFRQLRNKNFNLKILPARDSLLHVALSTENFEIIKELTDSIIPIDELNRSGHSPLISWLFSTKFISSDNNRIFQLNNNQLEILYHLIDKNVNLNIINGRGETPLHIFCCSQTASVVEKLIQNGAEVNKKSILGDIPLHFASMFSLEIVKLLLKNKSDIDIPNFLGQTPLCYAAQNNQPHIVKYLIKKGASVNGYKKLASPLNGAVLNGHVDCAELLIKRNAKINNSDVNNTLGLAVSFGHLNCVKLLINYEAKIFKDLLGLAISHHRIDIIKFLFNERKIPDHIKKEFIKSFLSEPIELYDTDIIDTLIPFGLDINAKLENGDTALHRASVSGLVNIIEHLIKSGSKVNVENDYGITPLTLAAQFNYLEIIKIYIKHGSDLQKYGPDTIFEAAKEGYDDILDYLISIGADINKINPKGFAPIHCASRTDLNCVRNLTQRGADVNLKTRDSAFTPLMMTAAKGVKEIMEYLVENNAKLDELNKNLYTALIVASQEGHLECVQFLIDKGSDVNRHGSTAICLALRHGHVAVADYLISVGADVNGIISEGVYAPIHQAVLENNLKVVKYLLTEGADVNSKSIDNDFTPLILAALEGYKEILEYLVKSNAKLDEPNKNLHTALTVASQKGHLECVQFLIDKGSDVNRYGSTAIYGALLGDHVAVANYLISVGADVNGITTKGVYAPIHEAVLENNLKVVKYLLIKGADVNSKSIDNDNTPLIIAAFKGSKEILECLVENNAKLDELNKNLHTALTVASQKGHLECVQFLIDKGSGVNRYGSTAIYGALLEDHVAVADYLISVGADVNGIITKGVYAPIHEAVLENNLKVVKYLLIKGADVNSKSIDNDNTPLIIAAFKGSKEILECLVENNAKLDELNKNLHTALTVASQKGHLECVQFLIDKGSGVNRYGSTAIYGALLGDHIAVADYLISVGADVNGITTNGVYAPIHDAVLENNLKAVKYLLTKGADVNSKSIDNDSTPLILAAFKGSKEILEYLVKSNEKLDELNKNLQTALIATSQEGHLECVQFLIDKGSDVNRDGSTAICLALRNGHVAVADYLISVGADVNGITTKGVYAPIHEAVLENNLKAVKYLLTKGADVNSKCIDNNNTPLILAALKGFKEILEYLVENNAKLDESNKDRHTALILASQEGYLECVKLLINKGSDIHKYGLFAIYIAALRKHTSVANFLISVAYGSL